MLPLEGLRVVELTTAWAGPMAGRVLAHFGATSFHIESPTRTNTWRSNRDAPNPPTYPDLDPGARPFDRCFTFNSQNINKRSLVIDLKTEDGIAILRDLLHDADVLLCNFRPGMLQRLGLDPADLSETNPGLIVLEMPAYGLDGPESSYAALGPTMEMASGMSAMIAYPGGEPTVTGPSYMDPIGGFNAAAAVLTALHARDRDAPGQHIEIGQVEAAMQFIAPALMAGEDVVPDGNHVPHMAPHNAYPAAGEGEWIAIAAEDDAAWRALAAEMGRPELAADPRFATLEGRKANEAALDACVAEFTRGHDRHALAERLQATGVAASAVETALDLAHSAYLEARGFFTTLTHREAGTHRHPGLPFHAENSSGSARTASPPYGEGNRYVLEEVLGLPPERVEALLASDVLADVPAKGV